MVLETPRLRLREMCQTDFPALCAILQDPLVMYAYEHAFSDTEVQSWLENQLARYAAYGMGLWAVERRTDGMVIGQCGLTMQPLHTAEVVEVGYLFRRDVWHQGYAIEAARACRDYAFQTLDVTRVYSMIREGNTPSERVAQRNGMKLVDQVIKHYYGMDMPHLVYAVDRPEL
jgi:ribosomal-protein-alanine N-acetyltransferase